jgi:hypothetical protein
MPRGNEIVRPLLVGQVGGFRVGSTPPADRNLASASAIEAVVEDFAAAWFDGDAPRLSRSLHPAYTSHIIHSDGGGGDSDGPSMDSVTRVLGVQAAFGPLTPVQNRTREVKVLDLREGAASILAVLGDWLAYLHLSRSGDRWAVVNVLWNWQPRLAGVPAR